MGMLQGPSLYTQRPQQILSLIALLTCRQAARIPGWEVFCSSRLQKSDQIDVIRDFVRLHLDPGLHDSTSASRVRKAALQFLAEVTNGCGKFRAMVEVAGGLRHSICSRVGRRYFLTMRWTRPGESWRASSQFLQDRVVGPTIPGSVCSEPTVNCTLSRSWYPTSAILIKQASIPKDIDLTVERFCEWKSAPSSFRHSSGNLLHCRRRQFPGSDRPFNGGPEQ